MPTLLKVMEKTKSHLAELSEEEADQQRKAIFQELSPFDWNNENEKSTEKIDKDKNTEGGEGWPAEKSRKEFSSLNKNNVNEKQQQKAKRQRQIHGIVIIKEKRYD